LTYAVWWDNNFVKTLSNFHSPVILRGGMKRKKGIDKPRGNKAILIALNNKKPTVRLIIRLIKGMELKLSVGRFRVELGFS
jgi:hypothetical protein